MQYSCNKVMIESFYWEYMSNNFDKITDNNNCVIGFIYKLSGISMVKSAWWNKLSTYHFWFEMTTTDCSQFQEIWNERLARGVQR